MIQQTEPLTLLELVDRIKEKSKRHAPQHDQRQRRFGKNSLYRSA